MHVGHGQLSYDRQATSWPKICRNRLPGMAHYVITMFRRSFKNPLSTFVDSQHTLNRGKSLFTRYHTHTYSHIPTHIKRIRHSQDALHVVGCMRSSNGC